MNQPKFVIEVVDDPEAIAAGLEVSERHRRNSEWLQAHWSDVLPQARGKILAVAEQEAFIADTTKEALEWVRRNHPGDFGGAIIQYVHKELGPRIYAYQR